MYELSICILVPAEVAQTLECLQQQAQYIARSQLGYVDVEVGHGSAPFHIALTPPFMVASSRAYKCVEQMIRKCCAETARFAIESDRLGRCDEQAIFAVLPADKNEPLADLHARLLTRMGRAGKRRAVAPRLNLASGFAPERVRHVFMALEEAAEKAPHPIRRELFPLSMTAETLTILQNEKGDWKPRFTSSLLPAAA